MIVVRATKPKGKLAKMLAEMGIEILPIEEDEGNVDRYVLSKRLAVERRTGSGFLRGIVDKTLFTSAIYLREHYDLAVLIVEGKVNDQYSAFNPQAVRGALSAMLLEYGQSLLSTTDAEETTSLLAMMARQEQTGIPEISLIPKRKATDLADLQRRVIEMLPGSGMVMARDLLQHFGSVQRITNATEAELRAVQGIGAKKASDIHRVLTAEYASLDTERDLEDAIEAEPGLIFDRPVILLARQHHIYTTASERHIVDLVFLDAQASELILVELKRGTLTLDHEAQLERYLEHMPESAMLRTYMDEGAKIRGILATFTKCEFSPRSARISVCIVDKQRAIAVLKWLRRQRLEPTAG